MTFFPEKAESKKCAVDQEELMSRFSSLVKQAGDRSEHRFLFQGSWTKDHFTVSQFLKIPNRYTPIIDGEITMAENGLLIRINYSLSQSSRRKLLIRAIVPLALTAFFILGFNSWLYGSITFFMATINYILAREQFNTQVNKSRKALTRLFSAE